MPDCILFLDILVDSVLSDGLGITCDDAGIAYFVVLMSGMDGWMDGEWMEWYGQALCMSTLVIELIVLMEMTGGRLNGPEYIDPNVLASTFSAIGSCVPTCPCP